MTTSEPIDPGASRHNDGLPAVADDSENAVADILVEPRTPTLPTPTTLAARRHPLTPQPSLARSFDDEDDFDDDDDDDDDHELLEASGARQPEAVATGPRLALVTPSSRRDQEELSAHIDRLSLEQALLDVEVANARVLDLTARLVEANQRIATISADLACLRNETEQVKVVAEVEVAAVRNEMVAQQAHLDAQRSSTAFRWAAKVWNLRNAIRS
jgi:hypothetical protein